MSANTETTGADRTKCKAFCGWRYFDMKMGSVPYESWARSAAWPGPAKDDTVFCSQNCHDARLPPIAAPAAHVERRNVEANERLQRQLREAEGANVMSAALIERLRGERAEATKRADALESLIDTERQVRKEVENTLVFVRRELAEARGQWICSAGHRHGPHDVCNNPFPPAPPPVESTPAKFTQQDADVLAEMMDEAAPPDNIRERLAAVEREVEYLDTRRHANEKWVGNLDNKAADHERRLAALEARGEPGTHATTSQEQEGRCQGMVADRQCTQRNGHGGGCHHMYTEAAMWIAPTKEHRFVPQRRHRGIPIDLCDECAHAESHPCHPVGAKP